MSLRPFLSAARRRVGLASLPGLLLLAICAPGRADIQQYRQRNEPSNRALRNRPANGVEQTVQVEAGSRVEITLQAHGQEGKTIEFRPHDNPAHGTLTDLRLVTRNTASVTYVQDPGDSAEADQFSYSVQAPGSGVSAPVTVAIQIIPLPAHLVATPAELDFGAVDVGKASRAQVTLENRGGSVAAGQLMPPSPWTVDGPPDYRLGKGEKQTFQLVFNPGNGRVFEDELVLGTQADQRARLFGTGLGAVAPLKTQLGDRAAIAVGAPSSTSQGSNASGHDPGATPDAPGATAAAAGNASIASTAGNGAKPAGADPGQEGAGGARPLGATYTVGRDSAILNDAGVAKLEVRWSNAHGMKLAWKTPEPQPKGYRVELRYLSIDPDNKRLVVDWRSYAQVEFQPGKLETAAILRGLPAGTRQTVRVVAVDSRDRSSLPSPMVQVEMAPGTDWLRVTPLRALFAALVVCLVFIWRHRREERLLLASTSASRASAA